MTADGPLSDAGLVAQLRASLTPQRFPVRREVELEGGARDGSETISFHDHFWPARSVLAVAAVRIQGGDIAAALRATGLRQLLRAVLVTARTAGEALDALCGRIDTADLDIALLLIDVVAGTASSAARGKAAVTACGNAVLTSGDMLWLAAGDMTIPETATVAPVEGIAAPLRARMGHDQSGAVCALLFKTRGRLAEETVFSLANTHGDIQATGEKVRRFLEMHSTSEEDLTGIDVVLDEVLTNAVNYGFEDGNAHEILLSLVLDAGHLTIEVQDDGRPFDPLGIPVPDLDADLESRQIGGLGMHFVRTLLDRVSYERRNGWNVLKLEKQLVGRAEKAS